MSLMSYEEYVKTEWDFPYIFSINKEGKQVYYFGEIHSYDPNSNQWEKLKKFWNEFLEATKGQKRIVFTEGGVRPLEETELVTITKWGGLGLTTRFAHQESIPVFSPEPNEAYERSELEKEFSRDQIQYYYFARMVLQWYRHNDPKPEFAEYMRDHLNHDAELSGWVAFDFSLEHMIKIHEGLFGSSFDQNDQVFLKKVSNPIDLNTIINHVSRKSGEIRDEYIVDQIIKYMEDGYSIFVQFGGSHAVVQKSLLEELMRD